MTHIDAGAIAAVTGLYKRLFKPGWAILDLMSSWVSHLPDDVVYREVVGLGMNRAELDANPRLTQRVVQDLNRDPTLPFETGAFDGAGICVSIQYLEQPVAVLREVTRVLRPGAPLAITFSNRCFPTKAVAIWMALDGESQCRLVSLYLREAGFAHAAADILVAPGRGGDPLYAVVGRTPGGRALSLRPQAAAASVPAGVRSLRSPEGDDDPPAAPSPCGNGRGLGSPT